MALIGYHASHEQFSPSELLTCAQLAEKAGFQAVMCSDHFYPWSERQGQSGFAWSWLGAAMQATSLSYGLVNAPGQRYHPAIVAQATATLAEMFPDRLWVALGSGQLLNEHITGDRWLTKQERNERLKEAVDVIRALWNGETVTHHGSFTVEEARLYSRPQRAPQIIGAALTEDTAEWVGGWADGIITVYKQPDDQKRFIEAFQRGGGAGKPMFLQAQISYAPTDAEAREGAYHQWRTNILPSHVSANLTTPAQFDAIAQFVQMEDIEGKFRISSSIQQHVDWIQQDIELGFERIFLHNLNREQRRFIEVFGEKVLPAFI